MNRHRKGKSKAKGPALFLIAAHDGRIQLFGKRAAAGADGAKPQYGAAQKAALRPLLGPFARRQRIPRQLFIIGRLAEVDPKEEGVLVVRIQPRLFAAGKVQDVDVVLCAQVALEVGLGRKRAAVSAVAVVRVAEKVPAAVQIEDLSLAEDVQQILVLKAEISLLRKFEQVGRAEIPAHGGGIDEQDPCVDQRKDVLEVELFIVGQHFLAESVYIACVADIDRPADVVALQVGPVQLRHIRQHDEIAVQIDDLVVMGKIFGDDQPVVGFFRDGRALVEGIVIEQRFRVQKTDGYIVPPRRGIGEAHLIVLRQVVVQGARPSIAAPLP